MAIEPLQILSYETPQGDRPLFQWLNRLKDRQGAAAIRARLRRVASGLLGDARSVGQGVYELRVHVGPGYRIYFAREGETGVVMLCAGEKDSQDRDVARAHRYWQEFRETLR